MRSSSLSSIRENCNRSPERKGPRRLRRGPSCQRVDRQGLRLGRLVAVGLVVVRLDVAVIEQAQRKVEDDGTTGVLDLDGGLVDAAARFARVNEREVHGRPAHAVVLTDTVTDE